jgi:hypothetical protein
MTHAKINPVTLLIRAAINAEKKLTLQAAKVLESVMVLKNPLNPNSLDSITIENMGIRTMILAKVMVIPIVIPKPGMILFLLFFTNPPSKLN